MEPYWRYFLALEEDLINFSKYVEFSQDNYSTYSIELARIYLSTCSEIDVVAKLLSKNLGHTTARNITDYSDAILSTYPNLPNLIINAPRYNLSFAPWSAWTASNSPRWWRNYNNVKHQRNEHYHDANLENVFNALSGLLTINLYHMKQRSQSQRSDFDIFLDYEMRSNLLVPDGFHRTWLLSGFIGWGGKIP